MCYYGGSSSPPLSSTCPSVRTAIPYRKSRRLRHNIDSKGGCMYVYDEGLFLLASPPLATVKVERERLVQPRPRASAFFPTSTPGHIPRPRNAFICFRSDYTVMSRGGAAEVWRGLSDEERRAVRSHGPAREDRARSQVPPTIDMHLGTRVARSAKSGRPTRGAQTRASTATSDSSWGSPVPELHQPPAARPASRKSTAVAAAPSRLSPSPAPTAVAETAGPSTVVEVPVRVPAPTETAQKKAVEPTIVRSPTRPSSYDRSPTQFGFKKDLSPTIIESLSLISPRPSRSPSPIPTQTMSSDDSMRPPPVAPP
ncbi:hypothetical protein B0H14DRAFT_2736954, partial [Mycena olivaceomarginata]